jgi:hypothetical protein
MSIPPTQFPASQRTSYQFPVYRWIGWLAVAGFAIGLTVMFFISGMFGIPAPLGWAALVILFTVGALLLDHPRLLLNCMIFYFLLMPSNRLLGLLGIPLPGFLDELFFLPFIAVIVMNWIQRRQLKQATLFPLFFCSVAVLSWYVNGRPSVFTSIQVTLVMLKSYILWYFCRLTSTFENEQQLSRWVWLYIAYALIQYFYNILWQRGLWVRFHPDLSGGVFGPQNGAHLVGYISIYGLLLMGGWWVSRGVRSRPRKKWLFLLAVLVIGYNLIFMTDTKHGLVLFPIAALPFLFHPKFPARLRFNLIMAGIVFIMAAMVYFQTGNVSFRRMAKTLEQSPKVDLVCAVTTDFHYLVPYPPLGAGPGRFVSSQAVDARTPLARRYIIPYVDQRRRASYYGRSGSLVASSVLGYPQSDMLVFMGEFGWLGAAAFYLFWTWVIFNLWRKSVALPLDRLLSGYYMALSCCLIFMAFTTVITSTLTVGALSFPIWILIGRSWDMKTDDVSAELERT